MNDTDEIYLCQVNEEVSCGACCGLYNLPDISREKLHILLSGRSEAFASVPRSEEDIYQFQKRNEGVPPRSRPFPEFYHCPFLGLIGNKKSRVGCLLHPSASGNNNVDYRFLSWYGKRACRNYFCPATHRLSSVYKSILIQAIDNWYDFGLIVTEHVLVTAYFEEMARRLDRHITVSDYQQNTKALDVFRKFFDLKSNWSYRRVDSPGVCNYFFENGLYPRPDVHRTDPDIRLSPYETIFREFDSCFSSAKALEEADQLLNDLFLKTVQAIKEFSPR